MSNIVAVLATVIVMAMLGEMAHDASLKRTASAGYVVIDGSAYRLVRLEQGR